MYLWSFYSDCGLGELETVATHFDKKNRGTLDMHGVPENTCTSSTVGFWV